MKHCIIWENKYKTASTGNGRCFFNAKIHAFPPVRGPTFLPPEPFSAAAAGFPLTGL